MSDEAIPFVTDLRGPDSKDGKEERSRRRGYREEERERKILGSRKG
jgi:hypothetical protein